MIAAILKENIQGENRVAATPKTVKELIDNGLQLRVQSAAGETSFHSDQAYKDAGAEITPDVTSTLNGANIVLKVSPLTLDEVDALDEGSIYVSLLQTTKEIDLVKKLTAKKVTGFSMHLIPRTTLAQSMDALSSQANIAGYKSVLVGAAHLAVYMPLLMTAAGTIPPAKVLIIGAGVAGLQAIATANRLGAQVEAFDVRPEVKEQVESLGAKFVEIESQNNEGVGDGGYAKETSYDYKKQQELRIKERTAKSDLVITTALIPGKPAPVLINKDMVENMKRGSVIVDLASENGGNCELTQKDKVVNHNGVIIDGTSNFPATMQVHASQLYARNVSSFVNYMIKDGELNLDLEDVIIAGAMFTHKGEITHQPTNELATNT
jgi:NAD(P) transhydrogenase subunit alpha